jgi:cell division protein FtsI (penicillin-binding protein 3)
MPTFSPARAITIMVVICITFSALLGRVAYLQTFGREQTIRKADRQQHMSEKLIPRRGTIFDANGQVLAATVQTQTLYIDPQFFLEQLPLEGKTTVDAAIDTLANLIDRRPADLHKLLTDKKDARFVELAEKVDEQTQDAIRKLDLPGIGFQTQTARYYPAGSLAAHILGGVGSTSNGLEGVELKFDKTLAGKEGSKRTLKDARRRGIAVDAEDYVPPLHGQHLVLTIDANIQMIAEEELNTVCTDFKAKRGEVIVMDPRTGDILALANWPSFNPQNLNDSPKDVRRNRALTDPYEPGSTIKPFIVGPALGWRLTRMSEVFATASPYTPYPRRHISDVHSYASLSLWDVLVKSSNVGMCKLAARMGNPRLVEALASFGYGKSTGIELPGEHPGILRNPRKLTKWDTESIAQGYAVMITPLQLARAFCAFANGGYLVQPRLVKGLLDPDGQVVETRPTPARDTLPVAVDPSTAADMCRILADVPVRGTASGTRPLCPEWNYFGKTGTAHISNRGSRGYSDSKYTSSFVGAAPFEDPRLVVTFIVHEVEKNGKNYYGGTVSAPGAARIFNRSLAYLQTTPSPDLAPPPPAIASTLYNYQPSVYKKPEPQKASAQH